MLVLLLQIWSGSSDGSVAVTDLDGSVKLDTTLARSLKTPSGKGTQGPNPTPLFSSSLPYLKQAQLWHLKHGALDKHNNKIPWLITRT